MMRKTLTYSIFTIMSLLVILAFITAKSYLQLGVAILLYPLLAYFALQIFKRKSWRAPIVTIKFPVATAKPRREAVDVADIDKRTFLKLVGAAGLSFFVFSLLGRRAENLLFGSSSEPSIIGNALNSTGGEVNVSGTPQLNGYRISEIDDRLVSYYGFVNNQGNWMIMREDTETSAFRYSTGKTNFPISWADRENLKYSYYHELF